MAHSGTVTVLRFLGVGDRGEKKPYKCLEEEITLKRKKKNAHLLALNQCFRLSRLIQSHKACYLQQDLLLDMCLIEQLSRKPEFLL